MAKRSRAGVAGSDRRAIELNFIDIDRNKEASGWGRIAAGNPDTVDALLSQTKPAPSLVEQSIIVAGDFELTDAVARAYFKLLACKDEYKVARLHSGFMSKIRAEYGGKTRIRFHLAPPVLQHDFDTRGRPRKRQFGSWMIPVFRLLAKFRDLRGTPFDIFGYSGERRLERPLIDEFEQLVEQILTVLSIGNRTEAATIVALIMEIRGYGPVREEAAVKIRTEIERRVGDYLQVTGKAA